MLRIAGQTAGLLMAGLTFIVDGHGWPGDVIG